LSPDHKNSPRKKKAAHKAPPSLGRKRPRKQESKLILLNNVILDCLKISERKLRSAAMLKRRPSVVFFIAQGAKSLKLQHPASVSPAIGKMMLAYHLAGNLMRPN